MKEFYLVPKTVYDRLKINNTGGKATIPSSIPTTPLKTFITPIPPPSLPPKQKQIRVRKRQIKLKTVSPTENNIQENPNIEGLIRIHFEDGLRESALSLFKIMRNAEGFKWNERGDLLHPLNKYNMIDILKDLLKKNVRLTDEQLSDYQYLLSVSNILPEHIRNKKIITQIRGGDKKLKGGIDKMRWISY